MKHYLRHENKENENKVLLDCEALRYMWNNKKKLFSIMSNLQIHYHYILDFQNVVQYTGGKWFIHGTKRIPSYNVLLLNKCRESITKRNLYLQTGLPFNRLCNQSEARKYKEFTRAWLKFNP